MIKEFPDKSREYLESLERKSSSLYKLTQDIPINIIMLTLI
jgi:hypothetical protein